MCGIFGAIDGEAKKVRRLATLSLSRGSDASGLLTHSYGYVIRRSSKPITALTKHIHPSRVIIGHSRLATNGMADNQPIHINDITTVHNGIIVNTDEIYRHIDVKPQLNIDTEVLNHLHDFEGLRGVVNCAMLHHKKGELVLYSNNGSLFYGYIGQALYFASERSHLLDISVKEVHQLLDDLIRVKVPKQGVTAIDESKSTDNLLPTLPSAVSESKLIYHKHELKRCTKCILPETMPFISFNEQGICNYCTTYQPRNKPKPIEELAVKLDKYRRAQGAEVIVPLSGGRDSCYGLHAIVKDFKLKPITYTYDWGMVTDLGRRNISRMCDSLGVENIIVSADIRKKRRNIRMNLTAWLRNPHLGLVSLLTSGDKHFFKYIDHVRESTGVSLNIWSINPLEVTHFKSGFLGVEPTTTKNVYLSGMSQQIDYQVKRFKAMAQGSGYFNRSLFDTLSGEYYRSINKKVDYIQLFDYIRWDVQEINNTLIYWYDWEVAPDTSTTWRIGDGTAAFYNYIYYTMAGFTEHDTFRSNQIREGDLTRDEALALVEDENRPRYQNIKWYLDAIGMDFDSTIERVNEFKIA
jgi:glutamine---fructose-6-phosphate transaminase (isomerizing)